MKQRLCCFIVFLLSGLITVQAAPDVTCVNDVDASNIFNVAPYTTIVVSNNYVLNKDVDIPQGCTLFFNGGKITGGHKLKGNGNSIIAPSMQIFGGEVTIVGEWVVDNYDVKWFGAKGNGKNDDTKAIQKTIDWAEGSSGIVYFPVGHYRITSSLTIDDNIELIGSSQHKTIIETDKNITMLSVIMKTSNGKYLNVRDICFDGKNKAKVGLLLHKVQGNSILERISVKNISGVGINLEGWCWTGSLVRSEIWNCSEVGLRLGPGSNDYTVDDVNFYICKVGVLFEAGDSQLSPRTLAIGGSRIANSVFESISESAIALRVSTAPITAITINNNYFEQIRRVLIAKDLTGKNQRIRNLSFSGNTCYLGKYGNNDMETFMDCSQGYIQNMSLYHNSFLDNPKSLIKLGNRCYDVYIYGNMVAYSGVKLYDGGVESRIYTEKSGKLSKSIINTK